VTSKIRDGKAYLRLNLTYNDWLTFRRLSIHWQNIEEENINVHVIPTSALLSLVYILLDNIFSKTKKRNIFLILSSTLLCWWLIFQKYCFFNKNSKSKINNLDPSEVSIKKNYKIYSEIFLTILIYIETKRISFNRNQLDLKIAQNYVFLQSIVFILQDMIFKTDLTGLKSTSHWIKSINLSTERTKIWTLSLVSSLRSALYIREK
jgi:hypothetical protein